MARTGAPSTTRRTLHYFWLVTRKHIGLFAALMTATFLFVALLSYGNPYVMSLVVDRVSAGSVAPDEVFSVFGPYIAALILINVAGQAASKVQDYTMYRLEIAASYDLATMSFDALSNQSMSFHSNRFGGTLVSQTTKFMSAYQLLLETITFPFLPVICSVVFTCAILAPRVPVYVAILMVLLAVYAGVSYYMYKRILHLNEQAASAQNQLSGELSDSVANILAVKTYGREDYERGLFDQANREVVARDSKRMWASLTRGIVTACITIAIMSVVAVFIAGGNAWYGITPGTLVVMFTYTYTVTNQFNFINNGLQRFNRAFGDASGMTVILDEPRLVDDKPGAPELEVREGAIDFEDIGFWYTDGDARTRVFDGLDLHIPAGQRVGLVGRSGSGKTTLVNLMARFWDVDAGTVSLGGEDVRDWKLDELMAHFAMVFQDVYLFNDTIENNIKFGRPDATHEQVVAAARAARCHDFVEALPEGYATMLGEGGATVSGGEKQRISIARALLKDAPIVLLDEATANVDPENEDELQAAIEELTRRKTVVMIAHRLKTVRHADQILVLDGGRIVQRGTHDELMAEGGIYEDFVRMREKALGWKVGAA